MKTTRFNVLLIEDDDVDAEMVYRAAKMHEAVQEIIRVVGAYQALRTLRDVGSRLHRSYIIVLDLSLPGISGIDFLELLRAEPNLADDQVFVLTGSHLPEHKTLAFRHRISAYVQKS